MSENGKMTSHDFNLFYARFKDKFVAIAMSYVPERMVAEDVVSECFINFCIMSRNGADIEIRTIPEAYVLRSVKNRCLNHLRDKQTRQKILDNVSEETQLALESEIKAFEGEDLSFLFTKDVLSELKRCLAEMPVETRKLFLLSREEGLTYKEIAQKRGISERMVKRHISKALEMLKQTLSTAFPAFFYLFSNFFKF